MDRITQTVNKLHVGKMKRIMTKIRPLHAYLPAICYTQKYFTNLFKNVNYSKLFQIYTIYYIPLTKKHFATYSQFNR